MRKIFLLLPGLFAGLFIAAQNSGRLLDWPMKLKNVSIKINADAFTATSFIEMEFCNPNDQEIEGLYQFRLEPGQAVTNFQLELNGKFRDGSVEEKWKANNAYNRIVGKRVDPALLNMDYENNYSLRIYPIPANSCRKITMTIQQQLKDEKSYLHYKLPLQFKKDEVNLSVAIHICNAEGYPFTTEGLLKGSSFRFDKINYNLAIQRKEVVGNAVIAFTIPVSNQLPIVTAKTMDDKTFFAIRFQPDIPASTNIKAERIGVWWDMSASAAQRDTDKEMRFLEKYIEQNKIRSLIIYPFTSRLLDSISFDLRNAKQAKWKEYLASFRHEGATDFSMINFNLSKADINFLFSDGRPTLRRKLPNPSLTQLNCVHAALVYDSLFIRQMIAQTGGANIDLNLMNLSSAVNLASRIENILLRIEGSKSTVHIDQSLSSLQEGELFVTGHFTGVEETIRFYYGNNSKSAGIQEIKIESVDHCDETATERLPMLSTFEMIIKNNNWYPQLEFGKKERVVTTRTSFIVLEKIEDYIQYNILPPKELQNECDMSQFVKNDQNMRNQFWRVTEEQILRNVITAYNQRLRWWSSDELPIHLRLDDVLLTTDKTELKNEQRAVSNPMSGSINLSQGFLGEEMMREVVVTTALGVKRRQKELGYSATTIGYDAFAKGGSFTLSNALSGRVAGLVVYNTNNAIVPDARIVLRGNRSITGNNQPLLVLDGVPVPQSTINYLNPGDIESVTVLKSGQAAALYGSDGVNGVLVINSKKKIYTPYYSTSLSYKLKNCEDVDYVKVMKNATRQKKLAVYEELKEEYKGEPNFYIDMSMLLYESGYRYDAIQILMSTADIAEGNISVLRSIGFVFEEWKEFNEAIDIYKSILERDPLNAVVMHDLALAYYRNGNHQLAIDKFYETIKTNFEEREAHLLSIKAAVLQEMNAIISLHKAKLDLSAIPEKLIRPIMADLRISISLNAYSHTGISVVEPNKAKCNIYNAKTANGGRFSFTNYWYGPGIEGEYQINNAKKGKYSIRLDHSYWHYRYYTDGGLPFMARIMIFKNFGKTGQQVTVENVMINNQTGDFEISEVNWE